MKDVDGLTMREARVLAVLRDYTSAHGISPSLQDLATMARMVKSNVAVVLRQLERKGEVVRGKGARNIRIVDARTIDTGELVSAARAMLMRSSKIDTNGAATVETCRICEWIIKMNDGWKTEHEATCPVARLERALVKMEG